MRATCRSCGESRALSQEAITSPDFDFTCPRCQRIMVLEHESEEVSIDDSERRDAPTKVDTEQDAAVDFDAYTYAAQQLGLTTDGPHEDPDRDRDEGRPSARLVPGIPASHSPVPSWDGGDTQQVRNLARNTPELLRSDPAPGIDEENDPPHGEAPSAGTNGGLASDEGGNHEGDHEDDDGAGHQDPLADMEVVLANVTAGTGSRTFDRPAEPEPPKSGAWKVPRSEVEAPKSGAWKVSRTEAPEAPKSGSWKLAPPANEATKTGSGKRPTSEAPKSGSWKLPRPDEAAPKSGAFRLAPTSDGPRTASSKRTVSAPPATPPVVSSVPASKKITEEIAIPKIDEEDEDLEEPEKQLAASRATHDSDWYDLLDEVLTEGPPPATTPEPESARRKIELKEGMSAGDAELVRELRAKLESQGDPAAELLKTRSIKRGADAPTPPTSPSMPRPDKSKNAQAQKVPETGDKNAQTQKVSELPETATETPATTKPPSRSDVETPPARPRPSVRPPTVARKGGARPPAPPTEKHPVLKKTHPRPSGESQRMPRSTDSRPRVDDDDTRNTFEGSDVPTAREAKASRPRGEPKGPREVDARGGQIQAFQRENLDPAFVTAREPASDAADRFRELFHAVFPHRRDAPQVVVVTSALPGEGRTTVAVNLAVAAAGTPGRGALLVSADPRGGPLLGYFGLQTKPPGLLEALEGSKDPRQLIMRFALGVLHVLPLGHGGELASSLLGGDAMGTLLGKLRRLCPPATAIIIDGPSLDQDVGAALARLADGCVLVVKPSETSMRTAKKARERLGTARLLGTILNEVPRHALGPRSAERAGLTDLREGIEQALGSLDSTVSEVNALRDAAERAREAQEDNWRAALANFQQGLNALEDKLGRAFRDELKKVKQALAGAAGAAAQNPAAKAQLGQELEKLKRAFQQLEDQKKLVGQSQDQLAKEKSELVGARRALEAELERQARGLPPSGANGPGEGELMAIQRALEEVRAMALSERARAHDAEDQVKRLTARVQDLVSREHKLRARLGVEAAAEAAGVPPPEGESPIMRMSQGRTDPQATVRPEYRVSDRPRPPESRPVDSQRFTRPPAPPQQGAGESQRFIRPTPESQRVSRLSSERVRALVDEPGPTNGDARHDTRSNPRPGASSERTRPQT